jgi:hypothetical protein
MLLPLSASPAYANLTGTNSSLSANDVARQVDDVAGRYDSQLSAAPWNCYQDANHCFDGTVDVSEFARMLREAEPVDGVEGAWN